LTTVFLSVVARKRTTTVVVRERVADLGSSVPG
jgi:hypothetical protein